MTDELPTEPDRLTESNLAAIAARLTAAPAGPYFWHGNVNNHDIALSTRLPGLGVCSILTTTAVERDKHGHNAQRMVDNLRDVGITHQDVEAALDEWAHDIDGEPRTDERLALLTKDITLEPAENIAVFEVARAQGLPDDTPISDRRIYRGDVVDLRNDAARFLASSWADVNTLLAEVHALRAENADLRSRIGDERIAQRGAWQEGVATALDHAVRNDDGITLRLDKPNPYETTAAE